MTRLVNAMRDDIADRMMAHTFTDRVEKLMNDQAALADQLYKSVYNASSRARMEDLPAGWLPKADNIRVRFGERDGSFYFNGEFSRRAELRSLWSFAEPRDDIFRLFPYQQCGQFVKVFEDTSLIGKNCEEWFNAACKLSDEIAEARKKLMTALNSYYTTEKLIEAWPEIAPFVLPLAPVEAPNLPALPTADLNSLFGLPVSA